MVRTFCRLQQ